MLELDFRSAVVLSGVPEIEDSSPQMVDETRIVMEMLVAKEFGNMLPYASDVFELLVSHLHVP